MLIRTRSQTFSVGTKLSEPAENGEAITGRTKPKTSTKEIRSITGSSKRALLTLLHRSGVPF